MAIRKRGKGRWQVRVRPFPETTVSTKERAEQLERDLKDMKAMGTSWLEPPTTLGEELDRHRDRKATLGGRRGKLRPRSLEFVEQNLAPWEPLRDVLIPMLRRSRVEDQVLARAKAAPVAARNELQELKAALRSAQSRGQQVDPGIFEIDPIRHEAAEGRAVEFERLLEVGSHMPERVKRLVPLAGLVGFRFSEVVGLRDRMVDLEAREITIPKALNKSRREKAIPLAGYEVQLIREQMLARPAGTDVLFPTERGRVYTKSGFRSVWLPALLASGLAHEEQDEDGETRTVADFRFHDLRHTATSLMCRAGMRPEIVALRRGDSDGGALVLRLYRHLYPGEAREAVGAIDRLVAGDVDLADAEGGEA